MTGCDRLPRADEINVYDSSDERHAAEDFLGKSLHEAEALFREDFIHYQEDLMWMGPRAFCFYVPAALPYLLSPDSDADAVRCFCLVVGFRLEYDSDKITPAKPVIRRGLRAILERFDRYGCDPSVGSCLRVLLAKLDA